MGLTGLWVCLMVLSAVSSSVVSCWLQCDWLQLDSGCESSIGSVGTASASVAQCDVLFSCQQAWRAMRPETVREGPRLLKNVILADWLVSVCTSVVLRDVCTGGCCVFSGVSLHSGGVVASFGLLQCVIRLWLKVGKKGRRGKGEGTKCSSVPKTPHPLEVCVVFVVLVLECGDEEWVVNQSYIVMLDGWCLVVCPLVSQGTFGPLYESGCVLTEEVDTWDGGCWLVMLSACVCLSLLAQTLVHVFGLAELRFIGRR